MLVGGVVVHDQMQLLVGVGAGDMPEEDEELLVSVSVLAEPGDRPVATSSAANKVVVPCRT